MFNFDLQIFVLGCNLKGMSIFYHYGAEIPFEEIPLPMAILIWNHFYDHIW